MLIRITFTALISACVISVTYAREASDDDIVQAHVPEVSLSEITRQAVAKIQSANETSEVQGSGPYRACMETDLALPNATLYRPVNLSEMGQLKLGVVIWGNGGCSNDGASARKHLAEIASHGYLVIAPGKMLTGPIASEDGPAPMPMQITIDDTRHALAWALAENNRLGSLYYNRIDTEAVAASGHSCGGMLTVLLADDSRIKTTMIHNSGIFAVIPDQPPLVMHEQRLQGIRSPVIFIMGGKSDLAYALGDKAYQLIEDVPAAFASIEVGHGGTFDQSHGGKAAQVAVDWLEWQLRDDPKAAKSFMGDDCRLCRDSDWEFRIKGLRK